MDELIERLAARTGIDSAFAEKPVGMIVGFLRKKGPAVRTPGLSPGLMFEAEAVGFTIGALDVTSDSSLIEKSSAR